MSSSIWQNWAGNLFCTPANIFEPADHGEISSILADAHKHRKHVRVVGSGHSWSPLVPTDGVLIRMTNFAELTLSVDRQWINLGPAVTVDQLAAFMIAEGVCVPSSVGIGLGEATMGGVFSTGCHGSGIDHPSVSDWIEGVELVTATGETRTYSLEVDGPDVINALRLSLGMLGIITLYRMRVQPMYNVHVVEWKDTIIETLANIRELVMENDYAEISWMPFNDEIWVQKANRTDLPATRHGFTPSSSPFRDSLFAVGSALALDALETDPKQTPDILRTSFQLLNPGNYVSTITHYVHCADYGFLLDRYKLIDIEAVFEIDESFDAVRRAFQIGVEKVQEWEAKGQYPLNVTLGFRFIRNSSALLSSCRGNVHTAMIELFSYHKTPLFAEFAGEILEAWLDELPRARTHWAKAFQYLPNAPTRLRQAFGTQIEEFLAVRKKMGVDPYDMFVNESLAQIFYGEKIIENSEKSV